MSESEVKVYIGIVGSRGYSRPKDVSRLVKLMRPELWEDQGIKFVVVSGRSPGGGPDVVAEETADKYGVTKKIFPVAYGPESFRTRAMARNKKIVERSDYLVAFWDGDSSGTANSLAWAAYLGVPAWVISDSPADSAPTVSQCRKYLDGICPANPEVHL